MEAIKVQILEPPHVVMVLELALNFEMTDKLALRVIANQIVQVQKADTAYEANEPGLFRLGLDSKEAMPGNRIQGLGSVLAAHTKAHTQSHGPATDAIPS